MIDETTLRRGLDLCLADTGRELDALGQPLRGKVRNSYRRNGQRVIVVTDRLSAFDHVLGTLPFKGQVLNGIATYWFEQTRDVAPNHLISVPDPTVSVVHECKVFAVEMIVRAYLTGSSPTSIWTHYASGARSYCGHPLADGLHQHQRLPVPIITPTTKAVQGEHDEPITLAQIVERGLCSAAELELIQQMCLQLFARGAQLAARRGLILVDTKYELGRRADGTIVFVDEIHTPDSSRYWYADSYEAALSAGTDPRPLDKDFVRRTLQARGYKGQLPLPVLDDALRIDAARRYIELYEQLTGVAFVPNLEPPATRIPRNLGLAP